MANEVLWKAGTSGVLFITNTLSDQNASLSAEFDNVTEKDRFCALEVEFKGVAAPAADKVFYIWFLYAVDGTNYPTYSANMEYKGTPPDAIITSYNVGTLQRVNPVNIPIAPFKMKALTFNDLGQDISVGTLGMTIFTYNEEIQ